MTNLNEKRKEQLSALFDNEQTLEERHLGDELDHAASRYSLIGDVMRAENNELIQIDIADQVSAALESEQTYNLASSTNNDVHLEEVQTNVASFNWKKPFAQFAIAASVAAVAIVGIQTMPQQDASPGLTPEPIHNLETMPFGGMATPVSYSTEPALETAQKGLRELEERRLGALILEHQRQTRTAHADKNTQTESENEQ